MKNKDVVLIVNYWHFEFEKASSRYRSLAHILCEDYDLEVITSSFCHLKKEQRNLIDLNLNTLPYKMTLQNEKGYQKNISIQRLISHRQFAKNVLKYLKNRKKPDAIIVSVPSLDVADFVTKYANKNHIPVIVDIQDLWPEAFKMALDIPIISNMLFYPLRKKANNIYFRADKIMAVSDAYVMRGLRNNKKDKNGLSIYIGSDSELIKKKTGLIKEIEKPVDEFWIGYIGSLGYSYDIESVILALKQLKLEGITNIKFYVMGEGPQKERFKTIAYDSGVDVVFTGLLEYGEMMKLLYACDIAVNPIVGKSVSSIINKVSDYAAAGLPVINTQNSKEYRDLIKKYAAGINVENGNVSGIAEAIKLFQLDKNFCKQMSKNAKKLFEEKFDRQKNYPKIKSLLVDLLKQ